jgi:uncharacterized protein (DUF2236 family)
MKGQSNQRRALAQIASLLIGSPSAVRAQGLLLDRAADPGLFGPASVTWRVVREPLLLLSGSRALLMQLAHPLVAQGVADHSEFESNPFGRLLATVRWVSIFVFGTTNEAVQAIEDLRRVHARIKGNLLPENATTRLRAGSPYSALDPVLDTWVYATLVDSMLTAHRALVGTLSQAEEDRFVSEWVRVADLVDARPEPVWETRPDLTAYIEEQIRSGRVTPVLASRLAARTVLHPPLPWVPLAPVSALIALVSTGLLPAQIRSGLELAWSPSHEALLGALSIALRAVHPLLPRRLRVSPLYGLARERILDSGS